jgi:prepilin-type N-terminal cleavage/methylation domain-containing protein
MIRSPHSSRRRRGFTLTELLIVLILLGFVALAGGRLFSAAIRLGHDSAETQNHAAAFDAMIGSLRSDVWSAASVEADGGRAVVHPAGVGPAVTWSSAGGVIVRDPDGGEPRQWAVGSDVTFALDGPALVVHVPQTRAVAGGELRLVNEVQLLSRMRK